MASIEMTSAEGPTNKLALRSSPLRNDPDRGFRAGRCAVGR
jgi:hypothetical protein